MQPIRSCLLTTACIGAFFAGILVAIPAAADESVDTPVIKSISVDDARQLLVEAGATVEKVEFSVDGFTITATIGPERHIWFDGMNCKGANQSAVCDEYKISAGWQVETATRAEDLAKKLKYNYTSVFAEGANIDLWRMDFIPDGVTRDHLRSSILEFIELRGEAENVIWPPEKSLTPAAPNQR
jgi:hypothetical protein